MIKFNDKFEFEKDQYCWHLHEFYIGKDKNKNPKRQRKTTFHATLEQVCNAIIDRSCGECCCLEDLKRMLKNTQIMMKTHAKQLQPNDLANLQAENT